MTCSTKPLPPLPSPVHACMHVLIHAHTHKWNSSHADVEKTPQYIKKKGRKVHVSINWPFLLCMCKGYFYLLRVWNPRYVFTYQVSLIISRHIPVHFSCVNHDSCSVLSLSGQVDCHKNCLKGITPPTWGPQNSLQDKGLIKKCVYICIANVQMLLQCQIQQWAP